MGGFVLVEESYEASRPVPQKLAARPGSLHCGRARDSLRSYAGEAGRIR